MTRSIRNKLEAKSEKLEIKPLQNHKKPDEN